MNVIGGALKSCGWIAVQLIGNSQSDVVGYALEVPLPTAFLSSTSILEKPGRSSRLSAMARLGSIFLNATAEN